MALTSHTQLKVPKADGHFQQLQFLFLLAGNLLLARLAGNLLVLRLAAGSILVVVSFGCLRFLFPLSAALARSV